MKDLLKSIGRAFLSVFTSCSHTRLTFPQTPAFGTKKLTAGGSQTYVVCLDCGSEFDYDWTKMRVGDNRGLIVATVVQSQEIDHGR